MITTSRKIQIPAVGRVPAFELDPMNRTQVLNLITRHKAYVRMSKHAWEARQVHLPAAKYAQLEKREAHMGVNAAMLFHPLGIKIDWPGLYPSFTVKGFAEHTPEAAVLAALGHPRNWLNVPNEMDGLTDEQENARGVTLAVLLGLKESKFEDASGKHSYEPPRYQTTVGNKTAVGLFRTIKRIIEEGK